MYFICQSKLNIYLLIEKSSFLGGRKDYWNYFIEGLNSVKGVTDGLKFVKAHSEVCNMFDSPSGLC